MEIITAAGWKIPAEIKRCNMCPENNTCPLNNFISTLEASGATDQSGLVWVDIGSKINSPFRYGKGGAADIEEHLVYECGDNKPHGAFGRGTLDLQVTGSSPKAK